MRINNIDLIVSSVGKAKFEKMDFAISCFVFHHIKDKGLRQELAVSVESHEQAIQRKSSQRISDMSPQVERNN